MPTITITDAPYSAVPDGGWALKAFTTPNGLSAPYKLVAPSSTWPGVAGDYVGKSIVVGCAGANGPQGGSPLCTTITSWQSPTEITLTHAIVTALPNAGVTYVNPSPYLVAWGTNNANAFNDFRGDYVGQTGVILNIPNTGTGVYLVSSDSSYGAGYFEGLFTSYGQESNKVGPKEITVNMTGATIAGGAFGLGGVGGMRAGIPFHSARTATSLPGATYVQLLVPSEHSRFSVGQWTMMTGHGIQGAGYPPSMQRIEYRKISAIDSSSGSSTYGRITFTEVLNEGYKSTWPEVPNAGGNCEAGGPGALFALDPSFDHRLVVNGGTIAQNAQWALGGLTTILNDMTFEGLYGPFGSVCKELIFNRCECLLGTMELDKGSVDVIFNDCDWFAVACQSTTAAKNLIIDNTRLTGGALGGGIPFNTTIRNGSVVNQVAALVQYGYSNNITVADSVINTFVPSGYEVPGPSYSAAGWNVHATMADGVITIPVSFYTSPASDGQQYNVDWIATGANIFFYDKNGIGVIGRFTVLDADVDGSGNRRVYTDWTGSTPPGSFPNITYGSSGLSWLIASAITANFTNVTGCAAVVDLCNAGAQGRPLASYTKRSYTGDRIGSVGDTVDPYFSLKGRITKIEVVVSVASAGAATANVAIQAINSANFVPLSIGPTINLNSTGTRTWTPAGGWQTTGGPTGDTLPNPGTTNVWAFGACNMTMTDLTANAPGTWPAFTVEIVTDQGLRDLLAEEAGIANSALPLRFRLGSA